jgi:hypothetical protein
VQSSDDPFIWTKQKKIAVTKIRLKVFEEDATKFLKPVFGDVFNKRANFLSDSFET